MRCFIPFRWKYQIKIETGIAGHGTFYKAIEPFKSDINKWLLWDHFKFKWIILHLVNKTHTEAFNCTP